MRVPPSVVGNLLAGSDRKGVTRTEIRQRAGLRTPLGVIETDGLSVADYAQLSQTVTLTLDDEYMGLGERRQRVGLFALSAAEASRAATLSEALHRIARMLTLLDNSFTYEVSENPTALDFTMTQITGRHIENRLLAETFLLVLHRFASFLTGRMLPATQVWFTAPPPVQLDFLAGLFADADIQYNAKYNGFSLSIKSARKPVVISEADAANWARRTPATAFRAARALPALTPKVTEQLTRTLREDAAIPGITGVAHALGLSPYQLRTRLRSEGTDFLTLRMEARYRAATTLLVSTGLSVEAISAQCGFSESSAFVRGFRKRTGHTPTRFRKKP